MIGSASQGRATEASRAANGKRESMDAGGHGDSATPDDARAPRPTVWILNHYANTPDAAAGIRHFSLAQAITRRGGEATIFAASFEHGSGRDQHLRGLALARTQMFRGVRFVWVRTLPYQGNTWRRMANMASYAVMVLLAESGRPRPDVVVGSTVHPFAALAGWLIARRRRARFFFEVRDLWPETMIALGAMSPGSLGARLLYRIESFLVRRSDQVLTVLPGMQEYLRQRGLPADHVHYLPNGADLTMFDRSFEETRPRGVDSLGPLFEQIDAARRDGQVVFAYVGSHGRVNRLEIILKALAVVEQENRARMFLCLVGDGPEKVGLERLADELGLKGVVFSDPVPKDRVPELLASVDVGVVHTTETPVYRYGISFNKVFDYMAAAIPIAFATSTWRDPVAAAGAGLSVQPDDPEALAETFIAMCEMPEERRRAMGQAGREYLEQEHDLERIGTEFARLCGYVDDPVEPGMKK